MSFWEFSGPDGGYADANGVAIGEDFSIYVADTRNDTVRRFTPFGKQVETIGDRPDRGPGAACRDRKGVLDRPRALAFFGDVLLVGCGERMLVRGVQRFGRDGTCLPPLRSCGDPEGRFGAPWGISAGPRGIFVADTLRGAIQRFTTEGRFVSEFSTAASADEASRPVAVASLGGGDLLVLDRGDRAGLVRFSIDGEVRGGLAESLIDLDEVCGLATDSLDRVYILDRDGERVQRLTPGLEFDVLIADLQEMLDE